MNPTYSDDVQTENQKRHGRHWSDIINIYDIIYEDHNHWDRLKNNSKDIIQDDHNLTIDVRKFVGPASDKRKEADWRARDLSADDCGAQREGAACRRGKPRCR